MWLFYGIVSTADVLNIQDISRSVIRIRRLITGLSPRRAEFGSRRSCATRFAPGETVTVCSASASGFPSVSHQRPISVHLQTTDHDVIRAGGREGGMMSVSGVVRGTDDCRAGLLDCS